MLAGSNGVIGRAFVARSRRVADTRDSQEPQVKHLVLLSVNYIDRIARRDLVMNSGSYHHPNFNHQYLAAKATEQLAFSRGRSWH